MSKMTILMTLFLGLNSAGCAGGTVTPTAKINGVTWMDGKPYFPLGVNYAWKDWGKDFNDKGWDARFKRIQADFDSMHQRGARVVRWWVYTDFVDSPFWDEKGYCTGMPKGWVKNFLLACDAAHARGMKLYPTFSSFDMGRSGRDAVMGRKAVRKSF